MQALCSITKIRKILQNSHAVYQSHSYLQKHKLVLLFTNQAENAHTHEMFPYLWVFFVIRLLRSNPFADQLVAHDVAQCQVVVSSRGDIPVFDERVVKMAVE